jgi:hypothetical protein
LKLKAAFVSQLRVVKDKTEIALMRKAAELAGLGMKTAYEVLSADMKEIEVATEIEYTMRKHGSYGTAFDAIYGVNHAKFGTENDTDGNGKVDYWEYYESGQLIRILVQAYASAC